MRDVLLRLFYSGTQSGIRSINAQSECIYTVVWTDILEVLNIMNNHSIFFMFPREFELFIFNYRSVHYVMIWKIRQIFLVSGFVWNACCFLSRQPFIRAAGWGNRRVSSGNIVEGLRLNAYLPVNGGQISRWSFHLHERKKDMKKVCEALRTNKWDTTKSINCIKASK